MKYIVGYPLRSCSVLLLNRCFHKFMKLAPNTRHYFDELVNGHYGYLSKVVTMPECRSASSLGLDPA